jgi:hypothetical protein
VVSNPLFELLLEVEFPVVAPEEPTATFTAFDTPLLEAGLSVFKIVGIM